MDAKTNATITDAAGGEPARVSREKMNLVIIGHVDHGKSTVVGRLLADTNSLPEGRLEAVKAQCQRNSKPFEYAFLLDALRDEQAQGITIDSARCFFRSARREYILIDAPGHVEFLKNMISGAARAEAGLLVIDAKEGVQENSRRHGYLMGLLGVREMAVVVNKMDLLDYDQAAFLAIQEEYGRFLAELGVQPRGFIPASGREGDNIVHRSRAMDWYHGPTVLEMVDSFPKPARPLDKPLRMPVQDVYKFTADGDDRRIVAGRIECGQVAVGDEVVFLPSGKRSRVAGVEAFSAPRASSAGAGQSTGLTLTTQVYVKPGELMVRADEPQPTVSSSLRAHVLWLSHQPMVMHKRYKMKLAGSRVPVWLTEVGTVLDASRLTTTSNRRQIERHDVAECTLQSLRPVACDGGGELPATGRFVLIDNYEIAGGGVILQAEAVTDSLLRRHVQRREQVWDRSGITPPMRAGQYHQRSAMVLITGPDADAQQSLARELESWLHRSGRLVYYLGLSSALAGIDADLPAGGERDEYLRRLGEIAHLFTDAGAIFITHVADLDDFELELVESLNSPGQTLLVNVGENRFSRRHADLEISRPSQQHEAILQIRRMLQEKDYVHEYYL